MQTYRGCLGLSILHFRERNRWRCGGDVRDNPQSIAPIPIPCTTRVDETGSDRSFSHELTPFSIPCRRDSQPHVRGVYRYDSGHGDVNCGRRMRSVNVTRRGQRRHQSLDGSVLSRTARKIRMEILIEHRIATYLPHAVQEVDNEVHRPFADLHARVKLNILLVPHGEPTHR